MAYTNILDIIYPINSVYWTTGNIKPESLIGGTWEEVKVELWNHAIEQDTSYTQNGHDTSGLEIYRLGNLCFMTGFGSNGNGIQPFQTTTKQFNFNMLRVGGIWTSQGSINAWPYGPNGHSFTINNKNDSTLSQWQWGLIAGIASNDATDSSSSEDYAFYYNPADIHCYKRTA